MEHLKLNPVGRKFRFKVTNFRLYNLQELVLQVQASARLGKEAHRGLDKYCGLFSPKPLVQVYDEGVVTSLLSCQGLRQGTITRRGSFDAQVSKFVGVCGGLDGLSYADFVAVDA